MRDLEQRLQRLREKMACLRDDEAVLKALTKQEEACKEELDRCRTVLAREQGDVRRLKGLTLTALLASLSGKRAERLEQEEREAYAASLRYESARRQLDELRQDMAFRRGRIAENRDVGEQYERLLREKSAALGDCEEIRRLERRLEELTVRCRELQEAIFAGEAVNGRLRAVASALDGASGWSTYDLLGGGLLADAMKYSHLDTAEKEAQQLQSELRRYQAELADVTVDGGVNIPVDGFLTAADVFFDNIFADWAVRRHIADNEEQIRSAQERVGELQNRLRSERAEAERELESVRALWRQTVEKR